MTNRQDKRTNFFVVIIQIRSFGVSHTAHILDIQSHGSGSGRRKDITRRRRVQQLQYGLDAFAQDDCGVDGAEEACCARVVQVEDIEAEFGVVEQKFISSILLLAVFAAILLRY